MVIYNYTVTGYTSLDELVFGSRSYSIFGGSVIYGSIQASKLCDGVSLITAIGKNEEKEFVSLLKTYNIEPIKIESYDGKTLSFINEYENDYRIQRVKNRPNLNINLSSLNFKTKSLHLGPLLDEIKMDIDFHEFANLVALDLQGLIRQELEGKIMKKNITELYFLSSVDVLKCDWHEFLSLKVGSTFDDVVMKIFDTGPNILIITNGDKGSYIITERKALFVPPYKPSRVVDPTGAGDVYLSSFIITYFNTNDLGYSALFASCASSFVIEDLGFSSIADAVKIKRRMKEQNLKFKELSLTELPSYGPARI